MTAPIAKASFRLGAGCAVALLLGGGAVAREGPVHGPGSSHDPIVYRPVHGPGSSHNPIVVTSTGKNPPPGTVVRDHRNGRDCQYIVGDYASFQAYHYCEVRPSR
jgi:hypothetical protein